MLKCVAFTAGWHVRLDGKRFCCLLQAKSAAAHLDHILTNNAVGYAKCAAYGMVTLITVHEYLADKYFVDSGLVVLCSCLAESATQS